MNKRRERRRGTWTRTRDISQHPWCQGLLSRWVWRFFYYRLTAAGRWLFWPLVGLMLFAAMSLELQAYLAFVYILLLWLVALAVAVVSPPRVRLTVRHADRICAGETLPVEITLAQTGRFPGGDARVLPAELPLGVDADPPDGVAAPALAPGETARVTLGLTGVRRGVYTLPGYRVESDYPFGLCNAYRFHAQPRALLVYPRFSSLQSLALPDHYRDMPGGVALKSRQGDSFELLGNREYQTGDNIRNIDWRATARLRTAILREYTQEYFLRVGVVLDTQVPARATERAEDFERAVSLCAAVSDYMARQDYLVDVFAAGDRLYHLTAGQSLTCLDEILDVLACVESDPHEPFSTLEPELSPMLHHLTLVICVLLDWDEPRRAFVERLLTAGVAVKLIIARDAPPTLNPSAAPWPGGTPVISRADFAAGVEVL